MKAIYLNIDPYLQAVADWLNAGKPGTAPSFSPLPVSVTIPLGESACIYWSCTGDYADAEPNFNTVTVDTQTLYVSAVESGAETIGNAIAFEQVPALSAVAPTMKYAVKAISGNSTNIAVFIGNDDMDIAEFTIPVLVRREQVSGPVDLVDFTPPAAAIAAGTDLKGCTFDGNAIESAADTGVLSAPAAGG